jgi:hypothetical protein
LFRGLLNFKSRWPLFTPPIFLTKLFWITKLIWNNYLKINLILWY